MKKRLFMAMGLALVMIFATGCGMDTKMVINDDYTSSQTETVYYNEEEVAELADTSEVTVDEMKATLTPTEVNGVMYYATTETDDSVSAADTKAEFVALNQNHVVLQVGEPGTGAALDEMGIEFMNYDVTFPKQIVKTNCPLDADGKTLHLTKTDLSKNTTLYAIFNEEAAKSKTVTYSGVTKGKIYKVKKYITINSKNVIKKVYITRNGKKYVNDEATTVNGKIYDNTYNKFAFVKDGKYVVKTTLVNGAVSTLKFTVDKNKPTTNMKAKTYKKTSKGKKITFKDATSGVKKATLNGKKIKNGKVVKKAGKYTLTIYDKAGNKRVVKFRIK
ncbi:MAG: hypothetical protein IKJ77_00325 [Firmicutes bacterium]|nr:hypothetical protein [Bacillota bacterium]